jgi:hypothetical protein
MVYTTASNYIPKIPPLSLSTMSTITILCSKLVGNPWRLVLFHSYMQHLYPSTILHSIHSSILPGGEILQSRVEIQVCDTSTNRGSNPDALTKYAKVEMVRLIYLSE